MDRGAWRATVHGIGKSRTGLSNSTAQQRLWASKQEPTSLNLLTHQSKSASLTTTDSVKLPVLCMSSGWLLSYQNACATLYCHSQQHHSQQSAFLIYLGMYVYALSHVWLFAAPWTVACRDPLYTGLSRHDYWSGLLCLPPGDFPHSRIKPTTFVSSTWQVGSLG